MYCVGYGTFPAAYLTKSYYPTVKSYYPTVKNYYPTVENYYPTVDSCSPKDVCQGLTYGITEAICPVQRPSSSTYLNCWKQEHIPLSPHNNLLSILSPQVSLSPDGSRLDVDSRPPKMPRVMSLFGLSRWADRRVRWRVVMIEVTQPTAAANSFGFGQETNFAFGGVV